MRFAIGLVAVVMIVTLARAASVVSSSRDEVTLQTSSASYCPGDTVFFTLANASDSSFWMTADPPWSVWDDAADTLMFPLYAVWLMHSLGPDSSVTYRWDQRDFHGTQAPTGAYYVKITGSLGMGGPGVTVADTFGITGATLSNHASWGSLKAEWK